MNPKPVDLAAIRKRIAAASSWQPLHDAINGRADLMLHAPLDLVDLCNEVERLRAFNDAQAHDWAEAGRNLTAATMERNALRDAVQDRDARISNQRKELARLHRVDKHNDDLLALVGLMARCRNVRASLRCGARLELEINCNDAFGVGAADAEPFMLDDVPAILAHLDRDPRDGDLRWVMERREARGEPAHPSPALAARLAGKP